MKRLSSITIAIVIVVLSFTPCFAGKLVSTNNIYAFDDYNFSMQVNCKYSVFTNSDSNLPDKYKNDDTFLLEASFDNNKIDVYCVSAKGIIGLSNLQDDNIDAYINDMGFDYIWDVIDINQTKYIKTYNSQKWIIMQGNSSKSKTTNVQVAITIYDGNVICIHNLYYNCQSNVIPETEIDNLLGYFVFESSAMTTNSNKSNTSQNNTKRISDAGKKGFIKGVFHGLVYIIGLGIFAIIFKIMRKKKPENLHSDEDAETPTSVDAGKTYVNDSGNNKLRDYMNDFFDSADSIDIKKLSFKTNIIKLYDYWFAIAIKHYYDKLCMLVSQNVELKQSDARITKLQYYCLDEFKNSIIEQFNIEASNKQKARLEQAFNNPAYAGLSPFKIDFNKFKEEGIDIGYLFVIIWYAWYNKTESESSYTTINYNKMQQELFESAFLNASEKK